MNARHSILICAAFGLVAASPVLAQNASGGVTSATYHVTAENGSGETGTVALTPDGAKATVVNIALSHAPGTEQPSHIHKGACPKVGAVAYPLNGLIDGKSTTTVKAPFATLTAGGFAINVHKSTSELGTYVACADLGSPKAATPAASSSPAP